MQTDSFRASRSSLDRTRCSTKRPKDRMNTLFTDPHLRASSFDLAVSVTIDVQLGLQGNGWQATLCRLIRLTHKRFLKERVSAITNIYWLSIARVLTLIRESPLLRNIIQKAMGSSSTNDHTLTRHYDAIAYLYYST